MCISSNSISNREFCEANSSRVACLGRSTTCDPLLSGRPRCGGAQPVLIAFRLIVLAVVDSRYGERTHVHSFPANTLSYTPFFRWNSSFRRFLLALTISFFCSSRSGTSVHGALTLILLYPFCFDRTYWRSTELCEDRNLHNREPEFMTSAVGWPVKYSMSLKNARNGYFLNKVIYLKCVMLVLFFRLCTCAERLLACD